MQKSRRVCPPFPQIRPNSICPPPNPIPPNLPRFPRFPPFPRRRRCAPNRDRSQPPRSRNPARRSEKPPKPRATAAFPAGNSPPPPMARKPWKPTAQKPWKPAKRIWREMSGAFRRWVSISPLFTKIEARRRGGAKRPRRGGIRALRCCSASSTGSFSRGRGKRGNREAGRSSSWRAATRDWRSKCWGSATRCCWRCSTAAPANVKSPRES